MDSSTVLPTLSANRRTVSSNEVATAFLAGSLARRHVGRSPVSPGTGATPNSGGEHRDKFDRLLAPVVRQRNAVIHGRTLTPEVLATVVPFARWLSSYRPGQTVRAAVQGSDIDQTFRDAVADLETDFEALATEPSSVALYKVGATDTTATDEGATEEQREDRSGTDGDGDAGRHRERRWLNGPTLGWSYERSALR
jgi:hypothetical protein